MRDDFLLEAKTPTHPRKRTPRWGILIAACLCAVLAGTAFAATRTAGFSAVEFFESFFHRGRSYGGISLQGGDKFIPVEDLSPEIRDLAEHNPSATVSIPVSDEVKFREFTGIDLSEPQILPELIPLSFNASLTSDEKGPTILSYTREYRSGPVPSLRLEISASVYTDRMDGTGELFVNYVFPSAHEFSTEEYTTENGLTALITHYRLTSPDATFGSDLYYADFSLNGIRWHLQAYCPESSESARSLLLEAVTGFTTEKYE